MLVKTLNDLLQSKGSTWASRSEFKRALAVRKITDNVAEKVQKGEIVASKKGNDYVFTLPHLFLAENQIITEYYRLQRKTVVKNMEKLVEEAQQHLGIRLHEQQIAGIVMALTYNVCIITGGAGTGKTSVLLALMYCIKKLNPNTKFALTAPTGKASRRMSEATGMDAFTLHKKLGLTEEVAETDFYLTADVIIADEFSMADLLLSVQLFRAVKTGAKLILVGDPNQLASVGIGTVLRSLMKSKIVPVTMLTKTFRQDDKSSLFKNISAIKNGGELESGEDFKLIKATDNPQKLLIDIYNQKCSEYGKDNVVILLPYRKCGDTCTEKVNRIIQAQVQTLQNEHCKVDDYHYFFVNDPVIQMENREVANGEVGKVICANYDAVTVDFEGTIVEYNRDEILDNICLAYAITIHKSQGSEYLCAITTCLENEEPMQSKNLLYTAVTRARKECVLIAHEPTLKKALLKEEDASRISLIEDKFQYTKMYADFTKQACMG